MDHLTVARRYTAHLKRVWTKIVGTIVRGERLAKRGDGLTRGASLQHHVDHTRDGVGTVLRGRAIAQNFDVVDHARRNRIEIHGRRTASHKAIHVHQRAVVPPLAVDEYQGLVGSQAAERGRSNSVGTVADGCARKVEAWRDGLNHLRRLGATRRLDLGGRQYVDRRGCVDDRAGFAARAQRGDSFQRRDTLLERKVHRRRAAGRDRHRVAPRGEAH